MSVVSSKSSNCIKCTKSGTGIVICHGCHQSFCNKHLFEHRQDILERAEQMKKKCQEFQNEIGKNNDPTSALTSINRWEEESINRIRSAADAARTDVEQTTHRMKNNFTQIVNKINEKIDLSRHTDDLTEIDLNRWNEELQTLKNLIEKPFPIAVINDDQPSATIRLIKIKYDSPFIYSTETKDKSKQIQTKKEFQSQLTSSSDTKEKFSRSAGRATISNDKSVVTFVGYSSVEGIRNYSQGIHRLKIDIIDKKHEGIFFGIITASRQITPRASELLSVYGWRDFDRSVTNGNAQLQAFRNKNIEIGDQLTLIIDCEKTKLVLLHHQLKKKIQMSVDIEECPFPWKFIISSFGEDVISIA